LQTWRSIANPSHAGYTLALTLSLTLIPNTNPNPNHTRNNSFTTAPLKVNTSQHNMTVTLVADEVQYTTVYTTLFHHFGSINEYCAMKLQQG